MVFSVSSSRSTLELQMLNEDLGLVPSLTSFMIVSDDISSALGYFLERSKSNSVAQAKMKNWLTNQIFNTRLQPTLEEFSVLKTDIRSMCSLENSKKILLELNGERLRLMTFSIREKKLERQGQLVYPEIGLKSVSERVSGYMSAFCRRKGLVDGNPIETAAHIDNLVHCQVVQDIYDQTTFKSIPVRDRVSGRVHQFKIYSETIRRLYKEYMKKLEDKIKEDLRNFFFSDLLELLKNKPRLKRSSEKDESAASGGATSVHMDKNLLASTNPNLAMLASGANFNR